MLLSVRQLMNGSDDRRPHDGKREKACRRHVVAVPYPGRGHINPMMNLCKLLAASSPSAPGAQQPAPDDYNHNILITFVVTEEWLGFIGSETDKPDNIRFATIPNVIPSELVRGRMMAAFLAAVRTEMAAPFEDLLDGLENPPTIILSDTFLSWAVNVGNRRNIPVASLWPMPATVFCVFHHFQLLQQMGHFPFDISEQGDVRVDYIPGVSSTRLADLPTIFYGKDQELLQEALIPFKWVPKAQYLLLNSIYEFEPEAIDSLRKIFGFPVYPVTPTLSSHCKPIATPTHYNDKPTTTTMMDWLDSKRQGSVLYVSFGSFLSVSSYQIDEIAAGLRDSGVPFIWVARGEAPLLKQVCGSNGFVVPWCDQLRVLSHDSVGGFWSHCGWNSVQEGVFCGVPFLTFPILMDQVPNSKQIAEDWKIGWRVNAAGLKVLVKREEIAGVVQRFMDSETDQVTDMRRRSKELQKVLHDSLAKCGSSEANINAFFDKVLHSPEQED